MGFRRVLFYFLPVGISLGRDAGHGRQRNLTTGVNGVQVDSEAKEAVFRFRAHGQTKGAYNKYRNPRSL